MIRPDFSARLRSGCPEMTIESLLDYPSPPAPLPKRERGVCSLPPRPSPLVSRPSRSAYTLVEMMIATALTLLMMAAVVRVFSGIGEGVSDSRSMLETSDRLRSAASRLRLDLEGVTAPLTPPLDPAAGQGYFEYTEGPVGAAGTGWEPWVVAVDSSNGDAPDTTAGDFDDMLMFTTRSSTRPFVGRVNGAAYESDVAEVAWFVRGRTLYRRVLLVAPSVDLSSITNPMRAAFYANNDLSLRVNGSGSGIVSNSLSDLANPAARYAHYPQGGLLTNPCHPHFNVTLSATPSSTIWATVGVSGGNPIIGLGLPTLRESSSTNWDAGARDTSITLTRPDNIDLWQNPSPFANWNENEVNQETGTLYTYRDGTRGAEDVILNNVIGFDVKVWDPAAPVYGDGTAVFKPGDPGYPTGSIVSYGAYVDLGYYAAAGPTLSQFSSNGDTASGLVRVYDTWTTSYESDGVDQDTYLPDSYGVDQGTNGFDDDGANGVDDVDEREVPPPYPYPARGIQVKIRVFEPDSRQVREVTIEQSFGG